ncbi:MAG: hypothetical protein MUF60_01575 [Vicinamibacterales bacterium]|jgi:hypothetical protein|nr:hypothetical protein [Vicinamibacterales bacterium]
MKAHLTPDEVMALAEGGAASPGAGRHLAACAACRREVEDLRALLGELTRAAVPEPSPLFWDHFSARVAQAVRDDPGLPVAAGADLPWWRRWAGWGWTLGTASAVAALLLVSFGPVATPVPSTPESVAATHAPATTADAGIGVAESEDWSLIAEAVDELDYDDIRAIGAWVTGPAELAVTDLDADEQRALARLLREEIARLAPAAVETL